MPVQTEPSAPPPRSSIRSVPSDPVAAREFLQARVSMYIGVALAIWAAALLSDRIISAITSGGPFAAHNAWYNYAHYAAIGVLASCYLVTRRVRCSAPWLRAMEVSVTLLQAVLGAILFGQLPIATRPEMLSLFG